MSDQRETSYSISLEEAVQSDHKLYKIVVPKPDAKVAAKEQARAMLNKFLELLAQSQDKHIAITYSANEEQSAALLAYRANMPPASDINGSGQAELFHELIELLNTDETYKSLKGKVHILPISTTATAVKKGEHPIPPQEATVLDEMLNIAKHLREGVDQPQCIVLGMVNSSEGNYAIGGGVVKGWSDTPLAAVVRQLLDRMRNGACIDEADLRREFQERLLFEQTKKAEDSKTSSLVLTDLLTSSPGIAKTVMELIAQHQNINLAVVKKLILCKNMDEDVLRAIASNPQVKSNKEVKTIIEQVRQIINKKTNAQKLAEIVRSSPELAPEVMQLIAKNPNTTIDTLNALLGRLSITLELLEIIAKHSNADQALKDAITEKKKQLNGQSTRSLGSSTTQSSPLTVKVTSGDVSASDVDASKIINAMWDGLIAYAKDDANKDKYKIEENKLIYQPTDDSAVITQKTAEQIIITATQPATKDRVAEIAKLAQAAINAIPKDVKSKLTVSSGNVKDVLQLLYSFPAAARVKMVFACTEEYNDQLQAAAARDPAAKELLRKFNRLPMALPMGAREPEVEQGSGNLSEPSLIRQRKLAQEMAPDLASSALEPAQMAEVEDASPSQERPSNK